MGITSLDITNSLFTHRTKITNIIDFDSKKLSIIKTKKNKIHVYYDNDSFFLSIDNLKGYFEHYDDKNNIVGRVKDENNIVGTAKHDQYLTIIFNNEYQKTMFTEILKRIDKDINKNYTRIKFETNNDLPTNILINIRNIVFVVRYQKIYINTCWYDLYEEKVKVPDTVY